MNMIATMIYRGETGVETGSRSITLPNYPVFASDAAKILLPLFDCEPEFYDLNNAAQVGRSAWVYSGVERATREPVVITLFAA